MDGRKGPVGSLKVMLDQHVEHTRETSIVRDPHKNPGGEHPLPKTLVQSSLPLLTMRTPLYHLRWTALRHPRVYNVA